MSIAPCLWFDGKAEEAARFYVSLLPDSRIDGILPYSIDAPGGSPRAGEVMMVEFTLSGRPYLALNGGPHFTFTPAISLAVSCRDQREVDRIWDALLEGGTVMQCGWITDRYGVTWQIVPKAFTEMLKDADIVRVRRVTEAMMTMVKLDLPALQDAFDGA